MSTGSPGVAIEILPVGKGAYAMAWSAPWGAAAMIVRRFAEDAERSAVLLGSAERARRDAPRLFHLAEGVGVAWCEDDGAYLAVLGDDGRVASPPRSLLPGGRTLCVAAGRRSSHVLAEDGEAVHVIEVRADGTFERAPEPLVEQSGRVLLAAARAGDASLLFAAHEGERRLAIVDATKGPRSRVRHDLPSACVAIDAYGVGSRAAFALAYAGDPEVVDAGVVDAAGKMVERRHTIVRSPSASHADVRVAWIEEDFHVIARDASSERATVTRLGTRTTALAVSKVVAPFAAAYHEKRFVLAQSLVAGLSPTLRLFTCDARGGNAQTIELAEPAPAAVRERRAIERAERCIEELEAALGGAGYRDARGTRMHVASGAGLALAAERQQVEIRSEGDRFKIVLAPLGAGESSPANHGLGRLARWARSALSGRAKKRAEADGAIGAELADAIGGELAHVERDERGLRIEIALRAPPEGARLAAWLRDARRVIAGP